ncbi:MAG: hypothetical protein WDM86_03485 [Rhizomicrobium sp.]
MVNRSNWTRAIACISLIGVLSGVTVAATGFNRLSREVTIKNGTRTAIVSLQAKAPGAEAWPLDLLNRRNLGVQKSVTLSLHATPECLYDLKVVFEDGHRILKQRVDLCRQPAFLLTDF